MKSIEEQYQEELRTLRRIMIALLLFGAALFAVSYFYPHIAVLFFAVIFVIVPALYLIDSAYG